MNIKGMFFASKRLSAGIVHWYEYKCTPKTIFSSGIFVFAYFITFSTQFNGQ